MGVYECARARVRNCASYPCYLEKPAALAVPTNNDEGMNEWRYNNHRDGDNDDDKTMIKFTIMIKVLVTDYADD